MYRFSLDGAIERLGCLHSIDRFSRAHETATSLEGMDGITDEEVVMTALLLLLGLGRLHGDNACHLTLRQKTSFEVFFRC